MEIEKIIERYDNGSYAEIYHKKGDQFYWHREDGPARIMYDKYGSIRIEEYYFNSKFHREDGPAWIVYNKDGSIRYEEYYFNSKFHREDGPAKISYNEDGSICYEEYRINGKRLSKEEWEKDYGWKLRIKDTPMGEIFCK